MNITKRQFRWLVTASVILMVADVVLSFIGQSFLPPPLRDYVAAQEQRDLALKDFALAAVGIPLLLALVVSIIGLYRFWWVARPLTVCVWVVGLVLQMFAGPRVEPGIAISLYELEALLSGIIIAVIYLTPAKAWFEKTPDRVV